MTSQLQRPYQRHNHQHCIDQAVHQAQQICRERGVRLTEIRQRVLELIWQSHRPRGAYDLMEELGKEGRNSAPPTVYRALDFLIEQGLVHRIESLNAYVACPCPEHVHGFQLLICRHCGRVEELHLDEVNDQLKSRARSLGFDVDRQTIELLGTCDACRASSVSSA